MRKADIDAEIEKVFCKGAALSDNFENYEIESENGLQLASFNLDELHGCCGVVIINHVCINNSNSNTTNHRAKLRLLWTIAEQIASDNDYTLMLATLSSAHHEQQTRTPMLKSLGWKERALFTNKKTDHKVCVFVKEIT